MFWLSLSISGQTKNIFNSDEIKLSNDSVVSVEKGYIQVPENRSNPNSRSIPIVFLKLPSYSNQAVNPIIYLAGGPGGSGSRALVGRRWKMFDSLRSIADVIILDQRGTGLADSLPRCLSFVEFPQDKALTEEYYTALYKEALTECQDFWKQKGIDLLGYTTKESAYDIEAVRKAIGADKFNLLGISYGTHLAMAYAKYFPESVDKMVLASPEGMNQTVKLPVLHDQYLNRLQTAINKAGYQNEFPGLEDIKKLLAILLSQLEENSKLIEIEEGRNNPAFTRVLGAFQLRQITGYMTADPRNALSILEGYSDALYEDDFTWFRRYFDWNYYSPYISLDGMATAMDIASGISKKRLKQFTKQKDKAVIGGALNFPMPQLNQFIEGIDLGDDFRADLQTDHAVLILSGTLDGRTFVESHQEVAKQFKNSSILTVKNAGHNIFMSHPEVITQMKNFLLTSEIYKKKLMVNLPPID
jgi:pimeloyl-ACP methyl ester carboxylesterase